MFAKVLVANRGEIAIRIFRTLRELGVASVAVYSEADRGSLHAARADEAFLIGPPPAAESYLAIERLLQAARRSGADAVHPGYGFLAENATFARAVEAEGLTWVGPPPEAIELMGEKTRARAAMREAGVPIIPGATAPLASPDELRALGEELGYPLLVKAAAGGGGRGMKVVSGPGQADEAYAAARREGQAYFADPRVYAERYLSDPRHVEVQLLADAYGNVIQLGERDCTIQRRHQKLVEETPSPAVDPALRERIGAIAITAARAAGYRSAGTVEGLLSPDGEYFFMEMNTRIQVEHTVTELVTGLDLVREQLRIAAGAPLSLGQEQVIMRGHAIECRINAEDPGRGFAPTPGAISFYREPGGPGVRVDSGVEEGSVIPAEYDSLVAKLIVHDTDRERARTRMLRALEEFEIGGITTLLGFHRALLASPCFAAAESCRELVESPELAREAERLSAATPAPRAHGPFREQVAFEEIDGRRVEIRSFAPEPPHRELARRRRARELARAGAAGPASVASPMQGTVLSVAVAEGEEVEAGALLAVVEAMKMENEVRAPRAGVVSDLAVSVGVAVAGGQVICRLLPPGG